MSKQTSLIALVTLLVVSHAHSFAQIRRPLAQVRPRQEPCWQVAGISKAAIQERQALARETRAQVEAVCADTSLTAQQRRERIREIRQQARGKSEGLITPQQREALQACQKERSPAAGRPHPPAVPHPSGTGPCGESLSSPKPVSPGSTTGHDNEPTPEQEAPPR